MFQTSRRLFYLLVAGACVAACARPSRASNVARYEQLALVERELGDVSARERRLRIADAYDRLFPPLSPTEFDLLRAEELGARFEAAWIAALTSGRPSDIENARRAFQRLEDRALSTPDRVKQMAKVFVVSRSFSELVAFKSTHPDIEALPRFVPLNVAMAPSVWRVNGDAGVLEQAQFVLPQQPSIVAVGHPNCHFSVRAVEEIEHDPVLRDLFAKHAVWIAPPGSSLAFDEFVEWNAKHPISSMSLAHSAIEFVDLEYWGTPSFYFFDSGHVVAHVVGWPREGRKDELLAAARKGGLIQ